MNDYHVQNCSNTGKVEVQQMKEIKRSPTLVYFSDGSKSIQHPVVYELFKPILLNLSSQSLQCIHNHKKDLFL